MPIYKAHGLRPSPWLETRMRLSGPLPHAATRSSGDRMRNGAVSEIASASRHPYIPMDLHSHGHLHLLRRSDRRPRHGRRRGRRLLLQRLPGGTSRRGGADGDDHDACCHHGNGHDHDHGAHAPEIETAFLHVRGMHCTSCEDFIETIAASTEAPSPCDRPRKAPRLTT